MPVAEEAVAWAYRLILQREPDNPEALSFWAGRVANVRELVHQFFHSRECRDRVLFPMLDQYVYEQSVAVEVEATVHERQEMLNRIARAWSRYGDEEPFWSVITEPRYATEQIDANLEAFYASGNGVADRVNATLARCGVDRRRFTNVIDFGCGTGRISFALAKHYQQVVAVDVSSGHLRRASERQQALGLKNVRFERIVSVDDIDMLPPTDLLVSFIVLQHNPPPVAAAILAKLLGRLRSGGVAVFQVPTFLKNYSFDVQRYLSSDQPQMEMNVLPQPEVFRIIREHDCDVLEVREDLSMANMPGVSQVFVAQRR